MLDREQQKEFHIDHERSGELVLVAEPEAWFTYYFWLDDKKAPDYARMVDIHKKPGYDPVEMFMDPTDPLVVPKVIGKLAAKKMGFRTVMDVIPLRCNLNWGFAWASVLKTTWIRQYLLVISKPMATSKPCRL